MKRNKKDLSHYEIGNVYHPILYKINRLKDSPMDYTEMWKKILNCIRRKNKCQ